MNENKITMETMQSRLKEIIDKTQYPNENGGIEMYLDYRDTLENSTLYDIMTADNPRETFDELISDWTFDGSLCYQDELEKEIKNNLTKDEIDFFNEHFDELNEWFQENYYFYYDEKHYNETVKVNIMLDTGNANSDFTRDNILNYCNYYSNGGKDLKDSSILWLARQQKKVGLLRKAIKEVCNGEVKHTEKTYTIREAVDYLKSCCDDLPYGEGFAGKVGAIPYTRQWAKLKLSLLDDMDDETIIEEKYIEEWSEVLRVKIVVDNEPKPEENPDKFIKSCIEELENLPSHMATLTFLVNMKLFDYFELREAMKSEKELNKSYVLKERKGTGTITISKDTMCGLFDVWSGGGSLLEIELDKDVVLPIKCIWRAEIETGKSEYGYSVDSVYGLVGSAWDGTVKEIHYMNEEQIAEVA